MKLLIIGGSYFFGRVYALYASKKHDITVFNRGTYELTVPCRQLTGDRHKAEDIKQIPKNKYDAVIDFCAYKPGDISSFVENFLGSFDQYILISTADVLKRVPFDGTLKKEDFPYEDQLTPSFGEQNDAAEYILGKIALEKELIMVTKALGVHGTILRPGVLYGPYNYASREAEFVRQRVTMKEVYLPSDADMKYSLCYIKDAALMALAVTGKKEAYDEIYHLCGEAATGEEIADALIKASPCEIVKRKYPEKILLSSSVPVPFGGTLLESQLYDGSKIQSLTMMEYTPLCVGMEKTYHAFAGVYALD